MYARAPTAGGMYVGGTAGGIMDTAGGSEYLRLSSHAFKSWICDCSTEKFTRDVHFCGVSKNEVKGQIWNSNFGGSKCYAHLEA